MPRFLIAVFVCLAALPAFAQEGVPTSSPLPSEVSPPMFEWGGAELDASRMELIRRYQRRRLWTQDTLPLLKHGRRATVRYSYLLRGGDHDVWGMVELLDTLGDTEGLTAYRAVEKAQTRRATALWITAGGVTALAIGVTIGTRDADAARSAEIASLQEFTGPIRTAEREALIRDQNITRTLIGASLATGPVLAAVTGVIYWRQRLEASTVWMNYRRHEMDALVDEQNRAIAEEIGLTEEEARLLQIHYGYRPLRTPPTVQVAVGPGSLGLSGTF